MQVYKAPKLKYLKIVSLDIKTVPKYYLSEI